MKHLFSYLMLGMIVAAGVFLPRYLYFNRFYQFLALTLSLLGYVAWGVTHHALEGRLSLKVVLEYVLLGLIVFLLLVSFPVF